MVGVEQHIDSHELHGAGATASITSFGVALLRKIQVNQHPCKAGLFGISYDDVVLRDISMKDVSFGMQGSVRLDRIAECF
jgi:hypothetical protein